VFRHVRAVEAIAAHCWVGSDGGGGATPRHRQTAEDSSLTLSISMQPTPSKTRLAQSSHDRLASTHDVPEQARPVVFDHQNDRPLVDAEVIGANPPSRVAVFDYVGLIERRFEPVKTVMPRFIRPKCLIVGTTISGAKGNEATTTHGETVPSSGPEGILRAM